ncbi:MAG TPA: potassium channel family protein, partial [Isosphaeraceae bacterium]
MSPSTDQEPQNRRDLQGERWELLDHVTALTDKLMTALAFVWLGLLVLDFTRGLSPAMQAVSTGIWVVFGLDFAVKLAIAPRKGQFLRRNWLTVVALLLPAFRVLRVLRAFRFLRAARAARSVGLLRLVTSLNRGMRALGRAMGRRGFGYVAALSVVVLFAGAAGMYQFENPAALRQEGLDEVLREGAGLRGYSEAVWWTAMILTTMGSDYWPKTLEGRVLCWALSLYAFAIFGYITATIASLFVTLGPSPAAAAPE